MKMNEEMKNCLLGLRMDITALERQRKEYAADIDLVVKQPHTLGTCQCCSSHNEYDYYDLDESYGMIDCMQCMNLDNDRGMHAVMNDEVYYAEAALEDMLMSIWVEQDHVEAPDCVVWADDIEIEELDAHFKKEQNHLKAEAYHRSYAFTDSYDPKVEQFIREGRVEMTSGMDCPGGEFINVHVDGELYGRIYPS